MEYRKRRRNDSTAGGQVGHSVEEKGSVFLAVACFPVATRPAAAGGEATRASQKKIAKQNKHLDKRFIFYNSGFNVRSTDVAASIGLSQFKDLDNFIKSRNLNRKKIINELDKSKKIQDKITIIRENAGVKASWFGIPMILSKKINKRLFIKKIEDKGIETRPIISGNFLKQPSIKKYNLKTKFKMKNAEYINDFGFFIGLPTKPISTLIIKKLVKVFEQSV